MKPHLNNNFYFTLYKRILCGAMKNIQKPHTFFKPIGFNIYTNQDVKRISRRENNKVSIDKRKALKILFLLGLK